MVRESTTKRPQNTTQVTTNVLEASAASDGSLDTKQRARGGASVSYRSTRSYLPEHTDVVVGETSLAGLAVALKPQDEAATSPASRPQ